MSQLTAFGMGVLLMLPTAISARAPEYDSARVKVLPKVALRAEPFSLREVRLLDGPFKHAMDLDHRYLLSLDPERLLHNFRINAGLPSTARPYGGWEAPGSEVRGHFVGHYLSACAMMYASTGDEKLKSNADAVVAGLAKCQEALKSGYLSAYPESFIDRVETGKPVWAPWYTLHKIYAGLLDMVLYGENRQALEVAEKAAAWVKHRTDRLSDEQMQQMLRNEHGGMNELLANLYAVTGNPDDLALSRRFNHHAVLDPLSNREDRLTGLHANTQIPKIIGAAREYELTGDDAMHTIASFFWDVVTKERSYVIGGNSDAEHFSPKERLSQFLSPTTTETCNTYNMLKLTRHLFLWDPRVEYADYTERALYNHILASQNPETGMMCYYVPLKSGSRKQYSTPEDSFWCCTGTGVENHSRYGDSIYFHQGDGGLYVNLFIPSELSWKDRGITLRQETRFPEVGSTRLTLTCDRPTALALHLRHPSWAGPGFRIRVNGKDAAGGSAPGSYATVNRTWKSGDTVDMTLPLTLHTEGFRDNPHRLAFLDGPIVLAAQVERGSRIPAIVVNGDDRVLSGVKPIGGKPLSFTGGTAEFRAEPQVGTPQAGTPAPLVQLGPFYAVHDANHIVYWDVLTEDQWKAREETHRAALARQKKLEARTVDQVAPNDRRSEREHGFKGEKTAAGDFQDSSWRDARDGGWFSWELKVLPDVPQDLVCTYWGSDGGGRDFDVLADGAKLATVRLNNNHPDQLFDETYPVPPDLLHGKEKITVRFQAHDGRMAGGVFGCRVLKR